MLGILNACTDRGANVEPELTGVDQRKEIFSQKRSENNERKHDHA